MRDSHLGTLLALSALVFWSSTPFFFASTGRRIGPFATNLTRLLLATGLLLALCGVGYLLHPSAPAFSRRGVWMLAASGMLGLGVGDHGLYRSLRDIGPERTSLLMTLSPAITASFAWFFLREALSPVQLCGMALVLGGVALASWPHRAARATGSWNASNGILAAVCQGVGTVLARQAFLERPDLSPLHATTLRVASGMALLLIVALATRRFLPAIRSASEPSVSRRMLGGTLTGPVGGMLCYIAALKHQSAGIVTTLTFMTPLLILPVAAWRYKTRLESRVLLGGLISLTGVVLLGVNF